MVPKIQPHHVTPHILVEIGSKFHSPSPSSLGGVRGKPPSGIKRFSFMNMYRIDIDIDNFQKFPLNLNYVLVEVFFSIFIRVLTF